jgi:hypothetical protein
MLGSQTVSDDAFVSVHPVLGASLLVCARLFAPLASTDCTDPLDGLIALIPRSPDQIAGGDPQLTPFDVVTATCVHAHGHPVPLIMACECNPTANESIELTSMYGAVLSVRFEQRRVTDLTVYPILPTNGAYDSRPAS